MTIIEPVRVGSNSPTQNHKLLIPTPNFFKNETYLLNRLCVFQDQSKSSLDRMNALVSAIRFFDYHEITTEQQTQEFENICRFFVQETLTLKKDIDEKVFRELTHSLSVIEAEYLPTIDILRALEKAGINFPERDLQVGHLQSGLDEKNPTPKEYVAALNGTTKIDVTRYVNVKPEE